MPRMQDAALADRRTAAASIDAYWEANLLTGEASRPSVEELTKKALKIKEENKRLQFLTLGGANAEGMVTTAAMDAVEAGLEDVKAAGFDGICFDIELTMGEQDLVEAQERAFAACKAAGLLVMVTTSHSAPYAAGSEGSKIALTESWMNSDDIDIFSPQLYTSGMEESPDFDLTPCREAPSDEPPEKARCTYERLKGMKAKWVPSLCSETHYEATKQFFEDREKALAERALHWLPNEDLAEAQDAAAQDATEGSWTLAVGADERDMEKAEMLQRIQRLESTEEHLSDRVSKLEAKHQEVMDRLELLRAVVMGGSHAQGT